MAKTPEIDLRENYGKNYIINGDMTIAQRGTSFSLTAGNTLFPVDRTQCASSAGSGVVATISQDTDVPTFAQAGYLFKNSLKFDVTTANASAQTGTNFVWGAQQRIEGYNWANLAQKVFTVSFWVKATKVGTYCVAARNGGLDRSCVKEYTINSSDTWEYKSVTFPASPSDGTWNYTNGNGLYVTWVLAAGPTITGSANVWQSGNIAATSNQVNGVDSTSNDFRITGVMMNEGYEALPFRLFGGDFQGELASCQRYYEKSYDLSVSPGTAASQNGMITPNLTNTTITNNAGIWNVIFKVFKRAVPSTVVYSYAGTANRVGNSGGVDLAANSGTSTFVGQGGFRVTNTSGGNLTATEFLFHFTAEAEL